MTRILALLVLAGIVPAAIAAPAAAKARRERDAIQRQVGGARRDAASTAGSSLWDARRELKQLRTAPRRAPKPALAKPKPPVVAQPAPPKPEPPVVAKPAPPKPEPPVTTAQDERKSSDELARVQAARARHQREAQELARRAARQAEDDTVAVAARVAPPVAVEPRPAAIASPGDAASPRRAREEREAIQRRLGAARRDAAKTAGASLIAARRDAATRPAPPSVKPVRPVAPQLRERQEQEGTLLAMARREQADVQAQHDRASAAAKRLAAQSARLADAQQAGLARDDVQDRRAAQAALSRRQAADATRHTALLKAVRREEDARASLASSAENEHERLASRAVAWAQDDADGFGKAQAAKLAGAERVAAGDRRHLAKELRRVVRERERWPRERSRLFARQLRNAEQTAIATAEDAAADGKQLREDIVREVLHLADEMEDEAERKEKEGKRK
ncbi:hypothetical protein HQ576_11745 [bacterium]|nr:hypothetical protein [bacterium]